MSEAKVAMPTTTTPEGQWVSSPMSLREADVDADLRFFADDESAKIARIEADPTIDVASSDNKNSSWASIAGHSVIVSDRPQTVGFALGSVRAAVTNNSDNDPITNNTVPL